MAEHNAANEIPQYGTGTQQVGDIALRNTSTRELGPTAPLPQYSVIRTLLTWAAAAVPMGLLGWIVAPLLARGSSQPGMVRLGVITVGLFWQFVMVLILLRAETGSLRWSAVRVRLWLQQPRPPRSEAVDRRLWWWLIPLTVLATIYALPVSSMIQRLWVTLFPALAQPPAFSMSGFLGTPAGRAQLVGNWGFFALFLVNAVLNTVIGEELLFRGLLLPRMSGAFGRWSWLANGVLFGFYHFHQPWVMADAAIQGAFLLALPSKLFRSAWFGIILHSLQSVYFTFIILGVVLGMAK